MTAAQELGEERCQAMHAAIASGRSALQPTCFAYESSSRQSFRIYHCPLCSAVIKVAFGK